MDEKEINQVRGEENGHNDNTLSKQFNKDSVDAGPRLMGRTVVENGTTSNRLPRKATHVKRLTDFTYNMNHENRGHFLIFNHMEFEKKTRMNPRPGTEKDEMQLMEAATRLGFAKVDVFKDLTKSQLFTVIKTYSMADHTHNDCFACVILTHGDTNDVLYARDETYKLKEITRLFGPDVCPTLLGKPKLFFIQACRGNKFDDGVKYDVVDGSLISDDETSETLTIPIEADFLLAYSTCPDYYSWRSRAHGSAFMQALCQCILEYGNELDLLQILTRVNRRVAHEFESRTGDKYCSGKKQIPSVTTRLTAEVFFHAIDDQK